MGRVHQGDDSRGARMPNSGEKRGHLCDEVRHRGLELDCRVPRWSLGQRIGNRWSFGSDTDAESSCGCGERHGLEYYKHIDTRRYLILDAKGRSYVRRGGDLVRGDFRRNSAGLSRELMPEVSLNRSQLLVST